MSRDAATRIPASASRSTPFLPLAPFRTAYPFTSSIMSLAIARSTGATRTEMSRKISTKMPPSPNRIVGPNCGSRFPPTMTSTPGGAIADTRTPAAGSISRARDRMRPAARCASPGLFTFSSTSPRSLLWAIFRDSALTATGNPMCRAASAASAAPRAARLSFIGMP